MKRKLLGDLISWKNKENHKPLIIYGARQTGKTYLVKEFAKQYYENVYEINFEFEPNAKWIFDENLTVENLILNLSAYKTNINIKEGKTLLFFDEVQKCPQVLTALKSFAIDKRFDCIASGSMLGIMLDKVSSYPVGYVETLVMKPMTFEEFLWANGYDENMILNFKQYFDEGKLVPEAIHNKLNELFTHYLIVGGMPEAVSTYIKTKNISEVIKIHRNILTDYKNDIAKYTSPSIRERVRECYDSIPDQLAKENKKYQYKLARQGGNARYFGSSLTWIQDSGLGFKVERLKTFDIPLRAYRDSTSFKFYYHDTGLLLTLYGDNVQNKILQGDIGIFKGAIYENVIAQTLNSNNISTFYYRRDDRLEIDFVIYYKNSIVPIEVKAGQNTKSISLNNIVNSSKEIKFGIKLSMNNINTSNDKIKCFPLYMIMFIKNE